MSYILDALLKADKERQRRSVPTLQSAQASITVASPPAWKRWGYPALVSLLSGSLLIAGWLVGTRTPTAAPARPAPTPPSLATPPEMDRPAAATAATKAPNPESHTESRTVRIGTAPKAEPPAPPAPVTIAQPAGSTAPLTQAAPTVDSPPPPTKTEAATPAKLAKLAPEPAKATESNPTVAPATTDRIKPSKGIVPISELPPALRKEIESQITISGYSQAADGAEPMAIINDRARRVGEDIAAGIKLEAIAPNGIVLNYKGYRFRTGTY